MLKIKELQELIKIYEDYQKLLLTQIEIDYTKIENARKYINNENTQISKKSKENLLKILEEIDYEKENNVNIANNDIN